MPSLGPPDLFRPLFEFLDEGLSLLDGGRSGCGGMTPVAAPIRADLDGGLSVPLVGGGGAAIVGSTLMDERRTASVDGRPGCRGDSNPPVEMGMDSALPLLSSDLN